MEAGIGYVDTKYGWHIDLSFEGSDIGVSDDWDDSWWWTFIPKNN